MSANSGETFVDIMGGLWLADYVGAFLTGGGTGPFFFLYMPAPLEASCNNSWGTFGMLKVDRDYHVQAYFAQYFAAQVVTREWVQPVDAVHRVFPLSSDVRDASGNLLVTAYAVERPDGKWSLLLINKDRENEHTVKIIFADPKEERNRFFSGQVDRITFGANECQWHSDGANGQAGPDGPPAKSAITGGAEAIYQLPKASITLRGSIAGQ